VHPTDFDETSDLPIGQVLRRITEARVGHADHAFAPPQLRLAADMEMIGNRTLRSPTIMSLDEEPDEHDLHLHVGSRYLPLQIDTSFGRAAAGHGQDLVPTGAWSYGLDATLLRLWVDEELAELASTEAPTRPATARPRPLQSAALQPAHRMVPLAVQQALDKKKVQVKQAVLEASRGDTLALARLMHGAEAARLLEQARARVPLAAGAESFSPAAGTALTEPMLRQLATTHPSLAIDASGAAFSFANAAARVHRGALQLEQRSMLTPELPSATAFHHQPGQLGELSEAMGQATSTRLARMFPLGAAEQREASRRAMTRMGQIPPAPAFERSLETAAEGGTDNLISLAEVLRARFAAAPSTTGPEAGEPRSARDFRVAGLNDEAAVGRQGLRSDTFGQTALRAVDADNLVGVLSAAEGRASMHWMRDGGRGVLLSAVEQPQISPAPPEVAPESYPAGMGQLRYSRPESIQPSASPALRAALQQAAAPRITPWTAAVGVVPRRLADDRAMAPGASDATLRSGSPIAAARPATLGYAGYDATLAGPFASMVADAIVTPRGRQALGLMGPAGQARGLDALLAPEPTPAQTARVATGSRPGRGRVGIDDLSVDSRYMPALSASIVQLDQMVKAADRMMPQAFASGAAAAAAAAAPGRPSAGLDLRAFAPTLTALLARSGATALRPDLATLGRLLAEAQDGEHSLPIEARGAVAAELAEAIERSYQDHAPGAPATVRPYRWWGESTVLLAAERQRPTQAGAAVDGVGFTADHAAPHLATHKARIAQLEQIIRGARGQAALAALQTARAAERGAATPAPAIGRTALPGVQRPQPAPAAGELRLFSPEKTLAMLAPGLEAGGLLDVNVRRELRDAVTALASSPHPTSPRRIRTAFGTLSVRYQDGRLIVDAEEASSNAPTVSIGATAPGGADLSALTAPTARLRDWSRASGGGQAGASPRAASEVAVAIGGASRAERLAGRFAGLAAPGPTLDTFEPTLAAFERATGSQTSLGLSGDDRVHVLARSPEAARLTGALAQLLASPAALADLERTMGRPVSAPSTRARRFGGDEGDLGAPAPAARAAGLEPALSGTGLGRPEAAPGAASPRPALLAGSVGASLEALFARDTFAAQRSTSGLDAPGASPLARNAALAAELAEAADRRSLGDLGIVGMLASAPGPWSQLSRAELAYVLPYLQRQVDPTSSRALQLRGTSPWAPAGRAPSTEPGLAAEAAARPSFSTAASLATPVRASGDASTATPLLQHRQATIALRRAVLEAGLDLGQAPLLARAARTLGLSNAIIEAFERGLSAEPVGASGAEPSRFAEAIGALGAISRASALFVTSPDRTLVARAADVPGPTSSRARLERIQRSVATASATMTPSHRDVRMAGGSEVGTRALSGAIARQIHGVQAVLEAMTPGRAPSFATHPAFAGSGYGALVAPAAGRGGAPALTGDPLAPTTAAASPQSGLDRTAATSGHAGLAGIWLPESMQRLLGQSADAFVGPAGKLEGHLVMPSVMTTIGSTPRAMMPTVDRRPPLKISSTDLDRVAHTMALSLGYLTRARRERHGAEASPDLVGLSSSLDRLTRSFWTESTASQSGIDRILASLDFSPEFAASGGGQSAEAVGPVLEFEESRTEASAAAHAVVASRRAELMRTLIDRAMPRTSPPPARVQGTAVSDKRELFSPFSAPTETHDAQAAPRAATEAAGRGGGTGGDSGSSQQDGSKKETGLSREQIEETAHEVWDEIKRMFAYELERRGIEP